MKVFLLTFLLLLSNPAFSQSVLDDLTGGDESFNSSTLANEKIEKVSISKRIFILSNNERSFDKGDFISLILNGELVCRAIAAKNVNNQAGVKIVKIYNLDLWNTLKKGSEVKVLRGDDSYYRKDKKDSVAESKIEDEADLFNETAILEDDLNVEDNKKRIIKTDNLISLGIGKIEALNTDGSPQRYTQLNLYWAFQVDDNIYVEAGYGQNLVNDYPSQGLDTKLTNIVVRGKYTFSGPMFSYIQPYLGFQVLGADSPGAGQQDPVDTRTEAELQLELQKLEDVKKKAIIFGVTALKRLVPGWFVRLDLGTDIISGGFSLEF